MYAALKLHQSLPSQLNPSLPRVRGFEELKHFLITRPKSLPRVRGFEEACLRAIDSCICLPRVRGFEVLGLSGHSD